MTPDGTGNYVVAETSELIRVLDLPAGEPDDEGKVPEIDVEGMDWEAGRGYLWLAGSHSLKRKKPKRGDSAADQIKRLAKVSADGNRFLLGRVPIQLMPAEPARSFLRIQRAALPRDSNAIYSAANCWRRCERTSSSCASFQGEEAEKKNIPGKDNGRDIEGLAVAGENRVFVGLRGPVCAAGLV